MLSKEQIEIAKKISESVEVPEYFPSRNLSYEKFFDTQKYDRASALDWKIRDSIRYGDENGILQLLDIAKSKEGLLELIKINPGFIAYANTSIYSDKDFLYELAELDPMSIVLMDRDTMRGGEDMIELSTFYDLLYKYPSMMYMEAYDEDNLCYDVEALLPFREESHEEMIKRCVMIEDLSLPIPAEFLAQYAIRTKYSLDARFKYYVNYDEVNIDEVDDAFLEERQAENDRELAALLSKYPHAVRCVDDVEKFLNGSLLTPEVAEQAKRFLEMSNEDFERYMDEEYLPKIRDEKSVGADPVQTKREKLQKLVGEAEVVTNEYKKAKEIADGYAKLAGDLPKDTPPGTEEFN